QPVRRMRRSPIAAPAAVIRRSYLPAWAMNSPGLTPGSMASGRFPKRSSCVAACVSAKAKMAHERTRMPGVRMHRSIQLNGYRSEHQFEPKLNLACLPRGVHDPEAGAFEHPGRRKEIGVIRRIERVGPKLELCLFRKSEAAEDRGVERHNSVRADMSDPLIAERIWS